jgi:hypothetical protein
MKKGGECLRDHDGLEHWFRLVVSYCSQIEIGAVAKTSDHGKRVEKAFAGRKLHLLICTSI